MRAEDDRIGNEHVAARLRTVLALVAWIVVASITVGSLLYTSLGRFFG